MVPEILEKLQALQEVLSKKYVLETEVKEIPKSLQTRQEVLNRLKKTYIEKNQAYEDSKLRLVDLRGKIEESGGDREKSEAMIVDISTQREYEALLKQIKDANEREQQFRKELVREEKSYEELSQQIVREEGFISQQEKELKEEQEKIQAEINSRRKILVELEKQEKHLTSDDILDSEIIFKFKRIIRKKEGRGVVPLRKSVCTGCNMILPLEFVNIVRSGQEIHFCPYCSMILFHEDGDESGFDFSLSDAYIARLNEDTDGEEELDEDLLMEEEMKENFNDDDADEENIIDEIEPDEEEPAIADDEDEEEVASGIDDEISEVSLEDVDEAIEDDDDGLEDGEVE
jgi:predicted  nucleic acid-binding Zn-ribbon protein